MKRTAALRLLENALWARMPAYSEADVSVEADDACDVTVTWLLPKTEIAFGLNAKDANDLDAYVKSCVETMGEMFS